MVGHSVHMVIQQCILQHSSYNTAICDFLQLLCGCFIAAATAKSLLLLLTAMLYLYSCKDRMKNYAVCCKLLVVSHRLLTCVQSLCMH
jgi:hypothetical protein